MFVLVRHAHAGDKHRWSDADDHRPLSRRGQVSAAGVAGVLARLSVTQLLAGPALRCTETLAPAADLLGLTVTTSDALAVGAPVEKLLDLLGSPAVDGAALCTHGEALGALSEAWLASGTVFVDEGGPGVGLAGTPKGACWVVQHYGRPGATAFYVPPPSQSVPHRDEDDDPDW